MKFEDVKNTTWGLLERSDFFEDGFLFLLYEYGREVEWDGIYELSYTTSDGSASGRFIFFKSMPDLGKFIEENDLDCVTIEVNYENNKILELVL